MTAQWLLWSKLGADTADVAAALLPPQVAAHPDRDGKVKLGLWDAWQVAGNRIAGPARDLIANHGAEMRDRLRIRNGSILAHGFNPVQQLSWERMRSWAQDRVLPVLNHHAREAGLKEAPESASNRAPGHGAHSHGSADLRGTCSGRCHPSPGIRGRAGIHSG